METMLGRLVVRHSPASLSSRPRGQEKVGIVMHEYKKGTLRSGGSGKKVTNRKQAIAIAMSEAGLSRRK